jgi:hypothetical protein
VRRAAAYARALSARYYGCPVYLVGSALTDPDPRDIDIVIPVPDDLFSAMYGDSDPKSPARWRDGMYFYEPWPVCRRWMRDVAKQGRELTLFCGRAVDFKTQPQSFFDEFEARPRLCLAGGAR